MAHVKANWKQERSHCVAHDAVDKPDREACGTASSGIGAVDCARHNMKRPNAVGDLQLGERYLNMDYMFFKSIAGTEVIQFFVSYDIACQWYINIWNRMTAYRNADLMVNGHEKLMTFLIPKFHLPAHIEACNLMFSFNLTRFMGLTDGEAPERGWANTNPLAASTKEMCLGARRDTLNDHFGNWNFKKIVGMGMGKMMLERTLDAVPMMVATREVLSNLECSFAPNTVEVWRQMAEAWDRDSAMPNPFQSAKKDDHLAHVRRELAEEAAAWEEAGIEVVGAVREDMHVTELIAMGLQLEEQHDRAASFREAAHCDDRAHEQLRRKIFAWMDIQKMFFPIVETLCRLKDDTRARVAGSQPVPGVKVQEIALWLPSAMMRREGGTRRNDGCTQDILTCKYRLRVGQANEALHDIRRHLLVRTHLYKLKDRYSRGVKANMRSKTTIDSVDERICRAVEQYRDAWAALGVLGAQLGRREWAGTLKELKPEDVRGMPRKEEGDAMRQQGASKKKGKGKATAAGVSAAGAPAAFVSSRSGRKKRRVERAMSWIWLVQTESRQPGEPEEEDESLRIEWARTRARCMRWAEEVDLLEEEMRRILQFLRWEAGWWLSQVGRRGLEEGPQAEGEAAYALRQSGLRSAHCEKFAEMWTDLPELIRIGRAAGDAGEAMDDEDMGEAMDDEDVGEATADAFLDDNKDAPIGEGRHALGVDDAD
ncbi:hypothetical protein C8R44DRAFT_754580 [Mycena epipterygia]|nr:hypothetical protein C8R44DRAFT_754580 [Mycena epipterygia]